MPQPFSQRRPDWRLVLAVFAVAATILVGREWLGSDTAPLFADTDDAMRMVRVLDFIGGQNWFDLGVARLNTPFGAELHWSRLVDLPLAGLVLALTPVMGAGTAMIVAAVVWPLALLACALWLSALLANRLLGPDGVLPAVVLPVLSPAVTTEFTPGRIDHHGVIIILTLATAWAAVEAVRRPRFALLCGLFAATALAIAIESLPAIAAAAIAFGLLFVADARQANTMRAFGLAFAAGTLVHLALFRPPGRWLEPACDVLSPVYLGLALVVAGAFTLASLRPAPAPWQRLLSLAVPGAVGVGLVLLAWPQCLGGPYGELDPWLQANWIANIVEAKPWAASLAELPAYAIAVGLPVLCAILVMLCRLAKVRQDRAQWAMLLAFLLAAAVVTLLQVRGARLAIMPAMPAAAWLILLARRYYLDHPRLLGIMALVASWLAFAGVALTLLVTVVGNLTPGRAQQAALARASKEACLMPPAFADLALRPPQRVMSPIDLGAHLLLYSPHAVVAAPYHRNQQGVRDAFRFFNDPLDTVRPMLASRGIDLVVICPGMAEVKGLPGHADDSFAGLYARGELPAWLDEISAPDSVLKVYAVLGP